MLTWLLVNVALSLLALAFIALNGTAPHRLRFLAGFAALVAWLVPWPLLPDLLPVNMFSFELWRIERAVEAGSTRLTGVVPVIVETRAIAIARPFIVLTVIEMAFIALSLAGCVLFTWKLLAHQILLRQLEQKGGDGNWLWARAGLAPVCPVGVQRDIAGAFSSGLLKPRIWVHGDLVRSPQLATLLRHELTHIRQHDNWYLLAITLVERLFWWNPLVWYLGRRTRELQELSCDELCQRANADYPAQLAQLMLDSARGGNNPRMLALGANIFNNPNPNVKRIQLLQRSYPMMTRHILGAAVTAVSAVLAVGFATAQPDAVQAVPGERVQVFRLERAPGSADDVLLVGAAPDNIPAGAHVMVGRGDAAPDQFVRMIHAIDGEQSISFSFIDTPLPEVLMPLVAFVSDGVPAPGIAGVAVVRRLGAGGEVIQEVAKEQLSESSETAGGTTSPDEGRHVVRLRPHMAMSDKLVLEYPDAAHKVVSVSGTNLSLDEAIDLIAEQSGCNIFQDGDTIVVDYCAE